MISMNEGVPNYMKIEISMKVTLKKSQIFRAPKKTFEVFRKDWTMT